MQVHFITLMFCKMNYILYEYIIYIIYRAFVVRSSYDDEKWLGIQSTIPIAGRETTFLNIKRIQDDG